MSAPHLRVVYTRPTLHLVPDNPTDVTLTCETPSCETTRSDVAWCDHTSLCPEHRGDPGCRHCRLDARWGR